MMEIRVANPNDAVSIGRIHVDTWRGTYEGIIPSDFLESLSYEQRADFWRDLLSDPDATGFIYVADHAEDGVVGFASGGPMRDDNPDYEGELFAIYVIEDYQHEGIGNQLFVKAIKWMRDCDFDSMIVWVLEDNPYRKFYESIGGQQVGRRTIKIGASELPEVAYGWQEISK